MFATLLEKNLTNELSLLMFVGLFLMTFMLDFIECTFVMSVQRLKPLRTACCRFTIMFIMAIGVMNYVANPIYIIPICMGSFCGSYFTVWRRSKNLDA